MRRNIVSIIRLYYLADCLLKKGRRSQGLDSRVLDSVSNINHNGKDQFDRNCTFSVDEGPTW